MKRFGIRTLGCKVNHYESEGLAGMLQDRGMVRSKDGKACDICLINTCAVTARAAMQSRQAVRRMIRDNPGARVVVTGCHAQTDPNLLVRIPGIDRIVSHPDKTRIPDWVCDPGSAPDPRHLPVIHGPGNRFLEFHKPVPGAMTRAYLKIQDGCDAFCTYCIVPHARGGSVSMPESRVLEHLTALGRMGFPEVILTGIHTGCYGQDLSPPTTVTRLLTRISRERPVRRVRLSSIEPTEITDQMLEMAEPGGILCDHFHVPLQSADDTILRQMHRPYTANFYEAVIRRIRDRLPLAGIGADILVGFPGESDAAFAATCDRVARMPVSYLHVFPFSPRKGTPAWGFLPRISGSLIRERCRILRDLGQEKHAAFIRSILGKRLTGVCLQTPDARRGHPVVLTTNYLKVLLEPSPALPAHAKWVDLICERWDKGSPLYGRVVAIH